MARLFQLLVLLVPTQLAVHFWPDWAFVHGVRVDFLAPSLYLTDIIAVSFIASCIVEKKFKISKITLTTFFIFATANLLFASTIPLSLFFWVRAAGYFVLGACIYQNTKELKSAFATPLLVSVIYVSLLAIFQFINKGSLGGAFWFIGERDFSINTPGIATVSLFGKDYLRPYSVLSHPNVLSGFVLLSLLATARKGHKLSVAATLFGAVAIVLAYSKTVFVTIGLLIVIYLLSLKIRDKTIAIGVAVGTFVLSYSFLVFAGAFLRATEATSIISRFETAAKAQKLIAQSPVTGAGLMGHLQAIGVREPVHNALIFIFTDLGILGIAAAAAGIFYIAGILRERRQLFVFSALLTTSLSDHYWLSVQQGRLFLVVLVGLVIMGPKWYNKSQHGSR